MIFFSPSTCGFYEDSRNADIPDDAIEVTEKERTALLAGQGAQKKIAISPQGRPVLIDRTISQDLIEARSNRELESRLANCSSQILMLAGRVDTLTYLISAEEEKPTSAEVAELPLCEGRLKAWRQYSVLLGRMPSSDGWPEFPEWPSIPE